jgi:hypothetical protein
VDFYDWLNKALLPPGPDKDLVRWGGIFLTGLPRPLVPRRHQRIKMVATEDGFGDLTALYDSVISPLRTGAPVRLSGTGIDVFVSRNDTVHKPRLEESVIKS